MITIRKATTGDCDTILSWENDPKLWSVTDDPGPFTREDIFDFLKENNSLQNKQQERWLIEHNLQPIGMIDLFDWDKIKQSIGIGIALPETQNRRKGYGYKALNILEKAMLINYGVKQIHCIIHQDNPASKRLFEKLEFAFERQEIHREKVVYRYSKNLEL